MRRCAHLSRPLENVGASNGNHKLAPVSQKYGVHGKTRDSRPAGRPRTKMPLDKSEGSIKGHPNCSRGRQLGTAQPRF
jgi:hypothetical protein